MLTPAALRLRQRLRQLLAFAAVGGVATLAHWAITLAMVQLWACPPLLASAAGFVLSAVFNFWANAHYTFAARGLQLGQALRFTAVALSGLACNVLVLALGLRMGWSLWWAQPLATLVVLLWNFTLNALWVFLPRPVATGGARAPSPNDAARSRM